MGIKIEHVILQKYPEIGLPDHYYLILDRYPNFAYEKKDNLLIAEDSGFYSTLVYEAGSRDAFAGRKFSIHLKSGEVLEASGSYWSAGQQHIPEPWIAVGIGTLEGLKECYVYTSGYVSQYKLNKWLESNTPSDSYWDYKKQIKDSK